MFKQKIYSLFLEVERKFTSWIVLERHKIFVLIIAVIFMWLLSLLPYLNLLISTTLIVLVVTILSSILFSAGSSRTILLALILFIPTLIAVIVDEYILAELISEYILGFLLVGTIFSILRIKD